MTTIHRIARNAAVLLISQVFSYLLTFVYMALIARHLGAGGFGILSFALAFTAMFSILVDLGLQQLAVREVARDNSLAAKYLANMTTMRLILGVATFGLIALTVNLLHYPPQTTTCVYLIGASVIFMALPQMFYAIFQAFERMEYQSIGQALNAGLMLIGVFLGLKAGLNVVGIAWLYFSISFITLVYSYVIFRLKFSGSIPWSYRKIEADWFFLKETLKEAWPFGLTAVFISIYYWISSVMLSSMKGDEAVGWYNAAFKLVMVIPFIIIAYFTSVFPTMSRLYISSKDSLKYVYEKSLKYLVIIALPIGVGTTLLANSIVTFIFGGEYGNSVVALQIVVWATVFIFASASFVQLFNSINRQMLVTIIVAGCALLNIVLNLILIPRYSYIGASIATTATEFAFLFGAFVWSFKIGYGIPVKALTSVIVKVSISNAAMCFFILNFNSFTLWGLIPLSALLYFVLLFIIGGIDKEDMLLASAIFSKRPAGGSSGGNTKSD